MKETNNIAKSVDAWWTVLVIDRLATPLAYALAEIKWITPNTITVSSLITATIASLLISTCLPIGLITGGIMYQVAFMLDCVDGKLARIKGLVSAVGEYLDNLVDRVNSLLLTVALLYAFWRLTGYTNLVILIALYGMLNMIAPCMGIAYSRLLETHCGKNAKERNIRMSRALLGRARRGFKDLVFKYIDTLRRHRLNPYPSEIEANLLMYTLLPIYMGVSIYWYRFIGLNHVLAIVYVSLVILLAVIVLRLSAHYAVLSRCDTNQYQ